MSYVSATANPNPGWTFAGWTGDASGTTNPTSVTMSSHKSITANFSQDEYSLDVTVIPEGMGSVTISPSKPNYHYGDMVTLTATPATGWMFTGWSGDVTSIDNPLALTITGNTNVTANFTDTFYIYLPLILKNQILWINPHHKWKINQGTLFDFGITFKRFSLKSITSGTHEGLYLKTTKSVPFL